MPNMSIKGNMCGTGDRMTQSSGLRWLTKTSQHAVINSTTLRLMPFALCQEAHSDEWVRGTVAEALTHDAAHQA